ncbi:hypothetical protein BC826DRAFT_209443 [Russula brevipes]|nr:hypothetical protein BC826DRAFT_209443 [Russula brevipes]
MCLPVVLSNCFRRKRKIHRVYKSDRCGRPSWDPFDPDALSVVDRNSQLGRDLAISLQASAEEEEREENNSVLTDDQIEAVTRKLPRLTEADLELIGHRTFLASLAAEETAGAMESPAQPVDDLGVTRLADTCGHLFCRKDLLTWIRDGNSSCPICRARLIKSSLDAGTVEAAQNRILAAWRLESQILNGDFATRSTHYA